MRKFTGRLVLGVALLIGAGIFLNTTSRRTTQREVSPPSEEPAPSFELRARRAQPCLTAAAAPLAQPPPQLPVCPDFEARAKAFRAKPVREAAGIAPEHQLLLAHGLEITAQPPRAEPPEAHLLSRAQSFPVILQASGPITPAVRGAIEATGARLIDYIPHFAFLAEVTPDQLAVLQALPEVRATRTVTATDKLSPFLADALERDDAAAYALPVVISALSPAEVRAVAAEAAALGAAALQLAPESAGLASFRAEVPIAALKALAARGGVLHIDEWMPVQMANNVARGAAFLNSDSASHAFGLTGKGQIVGHLDSGLDSTHPDLTNALHAAFTVPNTSFNGDWEDPHGHGTHTAGSILGDGSASGGLYRGVAPGAKLVHQRAGNTMGGIAVPEDLAPVFDQAYQTGARIHSNSWGMLNPGTYTYLDISLDRYVWSHPDFLVVLSAGNSGIDADENGVIDGTSTGSPSNAKNAIAVGAAESHRPAGSGGYSSYTNYERWSTRVSAEPIKSDLVSTPAQGLYGIAAFSSRGPTSDGRIKPDVVAPGTDIISTRLPSYSGWGALASNSRYIFCGGTSMAAPLITGIATLVREDLQNRGVNEPTAALLRALILNGAQSIAPGQYGTGATREIPAESPNAVEGFGLPRLDAILYPAGRTLTFHDRLVFETGQRQTFPIVVTEAGQDLAATLAWGDAPGSLYSARTLVNNLDLTLICPDGSTITQNDALNPAERILLKEAPAGAYTLCIDATHIPVSGGFAALAITAATQTTGSIIHTPPAALLAGQSHTFTAATHNTTEQPSFTYSTNGTTWQTLACSPDGEAFSATLTIPSGSSDFYYAFTAGSIISGIHRVIIGSPLTLIIASEHQDGVIHPRAGTHSIIKGAPITLSAYPSSTFIDNPQASWIFTAILTPTAVTINGTKTTLASGQTAITITPTTNTTLTWHFTSRFDNAHLTLNEYLLQGTSTYLYLRALYPEGATAETARAHEFVDSEGIYYAFAGRTLDDARWPAATGASPLQTTFTITSDTTLYDTYLPAFDETDGFFDFWRGRHFGTEAIDPDADPDADGFTNAMENLDNSDPRDPVSRPTPPTIAFTPPEAAQTNHPPWIITAEAEDAFTIATFDLIWRETGDANWQTNAFSDTTATIDPPSKGRVPVEYRLEATDLLGASGYAPHIISTPLYTLFSAAEAPLADLTPADWPTPIALGSETAVTFTATLTCTGGATPLQWRATLCETDLQALIGNAASTPTATGEWHLDTRRLPTGIETPVWYCGDASTGKYTNNTESTLTFPNLTIPEGSPTLTLLHWFSLESLYDYATIEIHHGTTTATLSPKGGYPSTSNDKTPCFTGTNQTWQTHTFDLTPYAGQTIDLCFRMKTDSSMINEGWYLGEITLPQNAAIAGTPLSGIEITPAAGTLSTLQSQTISLRADPAAFAAYGLAYTNALCVTTNDPLHPTLSLPFTLQRGSILTATAEGGTITPADAFLFPPNDSATFTLTSEPWHELTEITPALTLDWAETNAIRTARFNLTSQTDRAIRARFAPRTTPGGTPLYWLAAHYGQTLSPEALAELALLDTDSDGILTADEYLIGTDPTNPLSRLAIDALTFTPQGLLLRLISGDKALLHLEYKPALTSETWQVLETLSPPTSPTNSFTVPLQKQGFFRLRAEP